MTWEEKNPVALDLYYDPIVNEHVGGALGIIAPTWYFAPQRPEIAQMGWNMTAMINGVHGEGPITGFEEPNAATMLLQFAGEFADTETKQRIWAAADEHIEPTWDHDSGEFSLGFGLNEPHPRGQLNARSMAGWVCTEGAWSRIFNEPNLAKFAEPTVEGVDFPRVALSEARWDGTALHIAAHPQNAALEGSRTTVRITNVGATDGWVLTRSNGESTALSGTGDQLEAELIVDNEAVVIQRG